LAKFEILHAHATEISAELFFLLILGHMGKNRFRAIVDLHLLLIAGDQILLLRWCNTGYADGRYSVVAGHLEEDETFTAGIIREAAEEIGVRILPAHLELAHVMHHKSDSGRVALFFKAGSWQGEPTNKEPAKCDDLRWFGLRALPPTTVEYVRIAVEHVIDGTLFSEHGWRP
jgi:8-oxo-dGTP diphosphatase